MYDPIVGRWFEQDPEGFAAGDDNLYRYVRNDPTNATDPSGLISDREASLLVDRILNGSAQLSEISALSAQQLEAEIAILQRAVSTPHGNYPAELIRSFNEARISFLRGTGQRPGALLEYAEQWIAKQTPEWVRANSTVVERIGSQAARARNLAAQRAAQAAAQQAANQQATRTTASRTSRILGGVAAALRFIGAPYTIAVTEIVVNPTPAAGAGRNFQDQLTFPAHSPEIYLLPQGTFIMRNGLIYIPSATSTSQPPPGSVRVTGRVTGQQVLFSLQETLSSNQVTPVGTP